MSTVRTTLVVIVVAVLALLGPAFTPMPATGAGAVMAARAYQFPESEQSAARACYRAERERRGIPGDRAGYIVWWNAHAGTQARADWTAAYQRCQDRHLWTQGKWNWDAMVRVR
ncbi:hypothetical protein [Actinophytocola sp. NPDC049390]|uniref:hypothetical protein n=1 Tax=Actinophytocola sp. NPDC049390 TaxID=3363894 RepID=UPI003796EE0F